MFSVESESVMCEECVLCEFIRSSILNDRIQVQKRKKKIVANVFTCSIIKVACSLRFLSIRPLDDLERENRGSVNRLLYNVKLSKFCSDDKEMYQTVCFTRRAVVLLIEPMVFLFVCLFFDVFVIIAFRVG